MKWIKWLLIYHLSSGQWPDLKAVHSTYHRRTDGLPTWVIQSKDTQLWSNSSFPTIIYLGSIIAFLLLCHSYSFFLCPHITHIHSHLCIYGVFFNSKIVHCNDILFDDVSQLEIRFTKKYSYLTGTDWQRVYGPSDLVSISVGKTRVVCVSSDYKAWMRVGISAEAPAGTHWVRLAGSMRQIEIYENDEATVLWGTTNSLTTDDYSMTNAYYQIIPKGITI